MEFQALVPADPTYIVPEESNKEKAGKGELSPIFQRVPIPNCEVGLMRGRGVSYGDGVSHQQMAKSRKLTTCPIS
jgi:hypothetical protein